MCKNKRSFLVTLFAVLVTVIGQVSYADKKVNEEGSSVVVYKGSTKQIPIGVTGASIASYIPMSYGKEDDIKVVMVGINDPLAPEDMQRIAFKIENQSRGTFKLDNIFPKLLFVDEYVVQANKCENLESGGSCLFYINGKIIPLKDFSSKTYIHIIFINSNGQEDERDIRPWSPIVLYPNVCDFSQKQRIYIKNVYKTNLEILKIEEIEEEKEGIKKIVSTECNKKLISDQVCEFDLPSYNTAGQLPDDVRRLVITYKMGGQVQSDFFGVRNISSVPKYQAGDNKEEDALIDDEQGASVSHPKSSSSYGWHWIVPTCTATVIGGAIAVYFYVKINNAGTGAVPGLAAGGGSGC